MRQTTRPDFSILILGALIILIVYLCSCNKPYECRYEGQECPEYYKGCTGHTEPVNVAYFKQGDILYPDYAIPDTLIVVDAAGLNKSMALIEQGIIESTDGNIAAAVYPYCIIKP